MTGYMPKKLSVNTSIQGNIYSESLRDQVYINRSRFIEFVNNTGLPFYIIEEFGKNSIIDGNNLVCQLINLIWNNDFFVI